MQKAIKYTIFKTRWGYFGLAGTEFAILRTHLPNPERENVKPKLLKNLSFVNRDSSIEYRASSIEFDKALFKSLQKRITAYFEGSYVNFGDVSISLDGFSLLVGSVLTACRDIRFGQTTSYGQLAYKINRLAAASPRIFLSKTRVGARAVGGALAKNPLPLIIPCHRVTCANGKIGGFSATGGKELKAKLLCHEQKLSRERSDDKEPKRTVG